MFTDGDIRGALGLEPPRGGERRCADLIVPAIVRAFAGKRSFVFADVETAALLDDFLARLVPDEVKRGELRARVTVLPRRDLDMDDQELASLVAWLNGIGLTRPATPTSKTRRTLRALGVERWVDPKLTEALELERQARARRAAVEGGLRAQGAVEMTTALAREAERCLPHHRAAFIEAYSPSPEIAARALERLADRERDRVRRTEMRERQRVALDAMGRWLASRLEGRTSTESNHGYELKVPTWLHHRVPIAPAVPFVFAEGAPEEPRATAAAMRDGLVAAINALPDGAIAAHGRADAPRPKLDPGQLRFIGGPHDGEVMDVRFVGVPAAPTRVEQWKAARPCVVLIGGPHDGEVMNDPGCVYVRRDQGVYLRRPRPNKDGSVTVQYVFCEGSEAEARAVMDLTRATPSSGPRR